MLYRTRRSRWPLARETIRAVENHDRMKTAHRHLIGPPPRAWRRQEKPCSRCSAPEASGAVRSVPIPPGLRAKADARRQSKKIRRKRRKNTHFCVLRRKSCDLRCFEGVTARAIVSEEPLDSKTGINPARRRHRFASVQRRSLATGRSSCELRIRTEFGDLGSRRANGVREQGDEGGRAALVRRALEQWP